MTTSRRAVSGSKALRFRNTTNTQLKPQQIQQTSVVYGLAWAARLQPLRNATLFPVVTEFTVLFF